MDSHVARTDRSLAELLLPWLLAALMSAVLALLALWPGRACAQRDPQTEVQRRPGGAVRIPIPVPPELREGLLPAVPAPAPAAPPYYREREEGWFWYRSPAEEAKPPITAPIPMPAAPPASKIEPPANDPLQRLARQKEDLERLQALAILEPTRAHVAAYLEKHVALMEQSARFADAWQNVVWTTPEYDNTLSAPTGNAAYIQADVQSEALDERLTGAAQRYGLMFFFRGSCPHCHRFAPVLKAFAERYGFDILPVSLDGGALPEFPKPLGNVDAAAALRVESVPAVYLIEPRTRTVAPAMFGYVGFSELAQRVDSALGEIAKQQNTQGLALNGAAP
ncbi:MAG: conjugal transfer protein TraF [Stagnimonas sp.]|nr:conjugal transfer protein TraF [Stagnimonas sp.]